MEEEADGFIGNGAPPEPIDVDAAQPNMLQELECGICNTSIGRENRRVIWLFCSERSKHLFHLKCLHRWERSRNSNAHRCPLCREPIVASESFTGAQAAEMFHLDVVPPEPGDSDDES